jgi:hypothetical protein
MCFSKGHGRTNRVATAILSAVCLWNCIASITVEAATVSVQSDKNGVTVRGDEALKLLVGNTLRSVGDKKLVPEYRYFMSERFEYRCDGWDPANVKFIAKGNPFTIDFSRATGK